RRRGTAGAGRRGDGGRVRDAGHRGRRRRRSADRGSKRARRARRRIEDGRARRRGTAGDDQGVTELVARLPWTPRLRIALGVGVRLKAFVVCCVAALRGLEAWAAATRYGLRVTSDTPTFLPIIDDLAAHPFRPVSPFLDDPHVTSSHASPYMQLL